MGTRGGRGRIRPRPRLRFFGGNAPAPAWQIQIAIRVGQRMQHFTAGAVGLERDNQCLVDFAHLLAKRGHDKSQHTSDQHGNAQIDGTYVNDFTQAVGNAAQRTHEHTRKGGRRNCHAAPCR